MICRVCDSSDLDLVIDLGQQPWGNHFLRVEEIGNEPYYPLRVVFCLKCRTAQLDYTVPKEVMFSNHTYLSGITKSLSAHFASVAANVDEQFFKESTTKSVLDIGSNDGTQLLHFKKLGYETVGIESSLRTALIARENGVETVNEFFNLEVARSLGRRFSVVNAAGIFFHLEELHSAAEGVREVLQPNGVFVVQFLYMKSIIDNLAFDQIYHEHLLYYTLRTLGSLLDRHGLRLFDAYLSPIHGGSIIAFCSPDLSRQPTDRLKELVAAEERAQTNELETYQQFTYRIVRAKEANLGMLAKAKEDGLQVFGFGAPVKGNTLLNYFGIGTNYLDCLVEKNSLRRGLYSPGMHIPIVLESDVAEPPDLYYVLAWNFKREILSNNQNLVSSGVQFFFPVDPPDLPMATK